MFDVILPNQSKINYMSMCMIISTTMTSIENDRYAKNEKCLFCVYHTSNGTWIKSFHFIWIYVIFGIILKWFDDLIEHHYCENRLIFLLNAWSTQKYTLNKSLQWSNGWQRIRILSQIKSNCMINWLMFHRDKNSLFYYSFHHSIFIFIAFPFLGKSWNWFNDTIWI